MAAWGDIPAYACHRRFTYRHWPSASVSKMPAGTASRTALRPRVASAVLEGVALCVINGRRTSWATASLRTGTREVEWTVFPERPRVSASYVPKWLFHLEYM